MKAEVLMDKLGPPNPFDEPVPNAHLIPPARPVQNIPLDQAEDAAGCWWSGAHGIYIAKYLVQEALDRGWVDDDDLTVRELADDYPNLTEEQHAIWPEIVDDAERWLNEAVAPEGYSFGWHDGEFFFQPDYWWCEGEEGGYCDDPDHPHFEQAAVEMAARKARYGY